MNEEASLVQLPLIHVVENDDIALKRNPNISWFPTLRRLPWEDYREVAALYYEQLYAFNLEAAEEARKRSGREVNRERREDAQLRLFSDRPTGGNPEAPVLYPQPQPRKAPIRIDPKTVRPGEPPIRVAGKRPKCFFALLKAFIGLPLMGKPADVDAVASELQNNPAFARACGFTLPDPRVGYRHTDVPSRRKLQQFDQIMTENGLWSRIKWEEVRRNLEGGVIRPEPDLVKDTWHFEALSELTTVTVPDGGGKLRRKSQSKTTKRCRCPDRENCPHPWELADDGAGTVVKQKNQKHGAHKAAVMGLPRQGVPIDAVAVADAATHDGKTLLPHLERIHEHVPEFIEAADRILADSAYDSAENREGAAAEPYGLRLCASLNPRARKAKTQGLPRGMAKVTPYGEVICQAGHTMDYLGARYAAERFTYGPPRDEDGEAICLSCRYRGSCLNAGGRQRNVTIPFDWLPHIDPEDPPMAKRFKAIMKLRPAVERMIKSLKCDYGDRRLGKRGNAAFQARLDKTLIAIHIQLRMDTESG